MFQNQLKRNPLGGYGQVKPLAPRPTQGGLSEAVGGAALGGAMGGIQLRPLTNGFRPAQPVQLRPLTNGFRPAQPVQLRPMPSPYMQQPNPRYQQPNPGQQFGGGEIDPRFGQVRPNLSQETIDRYNQDRLRAMMMERLRQQGGGQEFVRQ